jgi:hypothetical protein
MALPRQRLAIAQKKMMKHTAHCCSKFIHSSLK